MQHTLHHAIHPADCRCSMADITHCVICEKRLEQRRAHVDTCGEQCFRTLLAIQRGAA